MQALSIVTKGMTYQQYVDCSAALGVPAEYQDVFDAIQTSMNSLPPLTDETYDKYLARGENSKAHCLSQDEFDVAQTFGATIDAMQPHIESHFCDPLGASGEDADPTKRALKKLVEMCPSSSRQVSFSNSWAGGLLRYHLKRR
jgi:hypothetical protein